ncbi:low-density lipoprotein receptor-related protein 6-like [Pecten maximus]|uniref:low-density lipoprotein receptor-related protein 6-like n=1 Tax=Pecten maximus TaxID=6579 RepID=UPI001458678C|nr:low-density lipoprotein receptor-related protein 6-like [Pecten maximus]
MDVNVADGSIYFFDIISQCINRLDSGNIENVHCGISSSAFTSIAYDWVSENMYWTDGLFNWIAVQPVNTTDRSMYRVIIQDDIEKPSALAVDSTAGVGQDCQFLTVDTSNKLIYYVDAASNFIKEYDMAANKNRQIAAVDTVSGIVFDWKDRNLYWSSRGKVKYATIATLAARELVEVSSPPSHLTIDSHSRTLFWVEGTSGYDMSIISMSLVSKEKTTILKQVAPAFIKDIFFDTSSDRLYIVQSDKFTSVARNGSDIQFFNDLQYVDKLIIYKRYAIWSTSTHSELYYKGLQRDSLQTSTLTSDLGVITGLAIFDEALQRQSKGPCSKLNGGCEQLCMTGILGDAVCECSYGLTLQSDGKTCSSVPQSSNFLLVTDLNHGNVFQVSTLDAQITALDINTGGRPVDALFDPKTSFVIWSEINDGSIFKSTLKGRNLEVVFTATVQGEAGTTSPGSVGVLKPSSRFYKILVNDLSIVYGLAIYPSKG